MGGNQSKIIRTMKITQSFLRCEGKLRANFCIVDNQTQKVYIMMEARITALFKKPEDYTVIER